MTEIFEMNPITEAPTANAETKNPNMNDDGKGKISIATGGGSGGAKFYTSRLGIDEAFIIGAGKDIESIMANGGFTMLSPEEDYNQYEWVSFAFNAVRHADGSIVYYFKDQNSTEPVPYELVGDDLRIGLPPL